MTTDPGPQASPSGKSQYILTYGLKLEKPVFHIAPGLSLRALTSSLSLYDLSLAGKAGLVGWPALGPFLKDCHCEITSVSENGTPGDCDLMGRARCISYLLHLLGFDTHLCLACSAYSWSTIADATDDGKTDAAAVTETNAPTSLPPFTGDMLDFSMNLIVPKDARSTVKTADAQWMAERVVVLEKLLAENQKLRFAIDALIDWRFLRDPRAAIARLWSGIEAIFAIKAELVYRLAVLSAALLSPRGQERISKFNHIKKLYGKRSKAVHGEAMSEGALFQATYDSHKLLRELLLHVVELGRPLNKQDFDTAIFC